MNLPINKLLGHEKDRVVAWPRYTVRWLPFASGDALDHRTIVVVGHDSDGVALDEHCTDGRNVDAATDDCGLAIVGSNGIDDDLSALRHNADIDDLRLKGWWHLGAASECQYRDNRGGYKATNTCVQRTSSL